MTSLDLTAVGLGFVSPVATTAREHVFLLRSEAAMHAGRPFVDGTGERLEVLCCPLIDPALPLAERLVALGAHALGPALQPLDRWPRRGQVVAHLCGPDEDGPMPAELMASCEEAWSTSQELPFGRRFAGAASCYEALPLAAEALSQGASAVVLLAVDSSANPAVIARRLHPVQKWVPIPPRLSEAAAALVVTTPALAAELSARFGRVRFAAVAPGVGSDLDDEPVDGRAMTQLVRQAATASRLPFGNVFGPLSVDDLRRTDWHCGLVRNRHAFALDADLVCVEHFIGNAGAASGLSHLVYALACQHHGALAHEEATIAWAISRDGTRGVGVIEP